jgi:hypothetical protein
LFGVRILESCADFGHHQEIERIPRPSYAKDGTSSGEKEFKQNNVREAVLMYAQENVHLKTKVQVRSIAKTILGALKSGARRKAASERDQMYCIMKINGERFAQ